MASIKKNNGLWRVQIYVKGIRESASFEDFREAKSWARLREEEIKKNNGFTRAPNRLVKHSERKYLDHSDLYDINEILTRSFNLPRITGIYFLILKGEIVYVGQSTNVHTRTASHLLEKQFDRVSVVECAAEHLNKLELLYIRKFNPPLNIAGKLRESPDMTLDDY